jgi:hypothetical protein
MALSAMAEGVTMDCGIEFALAMNGLGRDGAGELEALE